MHKILKAINYKVVFFVVLVLVLSIDGVTFYQEFFANDDVLSSSVVASPPTSPSAANSSSPVAIPTNSPSLAPTPSPIPKKSSYKIAVYGDSMVDTMGENLEYLDNWLNDMYPNVTFKLYNYGIGAENIEMGLARWDWKFDNRDRHFDAISKIGADIIVVGSFAYNPFPPHDKNRHWIGLTKLVENAKATGVDVYMLAEIAPLKAGFGKGPNGINWPEDLANEQAEHIIEQLQSAVSLSKELDVPLINVFEKSKANGNYGLAVYVNPNDGIHPSVDGHSFMASLIARSLKL